MKSAHRCWNCPSGSDVLSLGQRCVQADPGLAKGGPLHDAGGPLTQVPCVDVCLVERFYQGAISGGAVYAGRYQFSTRLLRSLESLQEIT